MRANASALRGSEGSSGGLEKEAAEEEYAQDDGKRDDDELDESHSRFLEGASACPLCEWAFYRRVRRRVNVRRVLARPALIMSVSSKEYARIRVQSSKFQVQS